MGGGQKRRRSHRWWKGSGICKRARRKEQDSTQEGLGGAEHTAWERDEVADAKETGEQDASWQDEDADATAVTEHLSSVGDDEEMSVFEKHYRLQGLFQTEEDWETFMDCLKHPLPVTFRVNRGLHSEDVVKACLKEAEGFLQSTAAESVCRAEYLAWSDTFQLSVDRRALKTSAADAIRAVKEWLSFWGTLPSKTAPGAGVITRQEVVSMIPAALLGLEEGGLSVLDLCAAPGSKTLQALDLLQRGQKGSGLVVANDIDARRAYGLAARAKPVGPANAHLFVVCHKAQTIPNVHAAGRESGGGVGPYDRVLCDVPCSGDGTLRKDVKVWGSWTPLFGLKIHRLQLQLALRGLSLLKLGGVMAYSTCSFNPIEDEAVVAALLERCGDAVELLDASALLPDVRRGPGFTSWKVVDEELNEYASYAASQHRAVPPATRRLFHRSMWPPGKGAERLKRCLRLYPQLQDTGGFFVALLRKKAPLPAAPRAPQRHSAGGARGAGLGEHLRYRRVSKAEARGVQEAASLRPDAMRRLAPSLYARASDCPPVVSYLSDAAAQHSLLAPGASRLNTVWGGVEVCRWDPERARYALLQSGVEVVRELVAAERHLRAPEAALRRLLAAPGRTVEAAAVEEAGLRLPAATPAGLLLLTLDSAAGFCVAAWREEEEEGGGLRVEASRAEAAKLCTLLRALAAHASAPPLRPPAASAAGGKRKAAEAEGSGEGGGGVRMSLLKGVRLKK